MHNQTAPGLPPQPSPGPPRRVRRVVPLIAVTMLGIAGGAVSITLLAVGPADPTAVSATVAPTTTADPRIDCVPGADEGTGPDHWLCDPSGQWVPDPTAEPTTTTEPPAPTTVPLPPTTSTPPAPPAATAPPAPLDTSPPVSPTAPPQPSTTPPPPDPDVEFYAAFERSLGGERDALQGRLQDVSAAANASDMVSVIAIAHRNWAPICRHGELRRAAARMARSSRRGDHWRLPAILIGVD